MWKIPIGIIRDVHQRSIKWLMMMIKISCKNKCKIKHLHLEKDIKDQIKDFSKQIFNYQAYFLTPLYTGGIKID